MTLKFDYKYLLASLLVILFGIISRKIETIPLFIGDVLYAMMIYCLVHCFFVYHNKTIQFTIPLSICFIIELSQLINTNWLNTIRNTTLGHYVLGQGFLWTDLLCYTLGISIAFIIDYYRKN